MHRLQSSPSNRCERSNTRAGCRGGIGREAPPLAWIAVTLVRRHLATELEVSLESLRLKDERRQRGQQKDGSEDQRKPQKRLPQLASRLNQRDSGAQPLERTEHQQNLQRACGPRLAHERQD